MFHQEISDSSSNIFGCIVNRQCSWIYNIFQLSTRGRVFRGAYSYPDTKSNNLADNKPEALYTHLG